MTSSESVYAASFALLQTLSVGGNFNTISRRLKHVEDVDPLAMPAVYQLQINRQPTIETLQGIAVWTLRCHWYIYVSAPDETAPSSPLLNPRVDEVLNLLPQDPEQAVQVSVGDLQIAITADGPVEFFEGLLGNKSVARIPIRMLVPNEGS